MSAIPLSRASSGLAGAYARPSTSIVPASGLISPASTFIKVLLPAPFSPISAWTSPFCKRRFTPSSATVGPKRLLILERERVVIDLSVMCPIQPAAATPLGLEIQQSIVPRVAATATPGLKDATALRFTKHKDQSSKNYRF